MGESTLLAIKRLIQKTFCAIFIIYAVHTPRTPHEQQTQSTRTPSVIYFTNTQHDGAHIMPTTVSKMTFTDANTRENFPEASPKGPGLQYFMALAGQRTPRTLGIQGQASRPPKPKHKTPQTNDKTSETRKIAPLKQHCNYLTIKPALATPKSLHMHTGNGGCDQSTHPPTGSYRRRSDAPCRIIPDTDLAAIYHSPPS